MYYYSTIRLILIYRPSEGGRLSQPIALSYEFRAETTQDDRQTSKLVAGGQDELAFNDRSHEQLRYHIIERIQLNVGALKLSPLTT